MAFRIKPTSGKTLVEYVAMIEEPRGGCVAHDLPEMQVIVTCAMFSEVEAFVDIFGWALPKELWLRRLLRRCAERQTGAHRDALLHQFGRARP